MLILGFETSTGVCSVALADSERILAEYTLESGVFHSERLLPMAERILSDAQVGLSELDGVAVSSGPGSFTGLRIGMSTAKGLCMALKLPLLAVPTLQGLAWSALSDGMVVSAMLDARRGEVYAGAYRMDGGVPVVLIEDQAGPVQTILAQLPRPVLFTGDGACVYRAQILEHLGQDACFCPSERNRPSAGAVAVLGLDRLVRGDVADPAVIEPTYVRRSQAERVREARPV